MVDYSKWSHIEISDDEDETHPNIDTPSLFRWRHRARVERAETEERETADFEKTKNEHEKRLAECKDRLKAIDLKEDGADEQKQEADRIKAELDALKKRSKELKKKEVELEKTRKETPWNVDTISHDKFQKTVLNKSPPVPKKENMTEAEIEESYGSFRTKYEKEIKTFGMMRKWDDSKQYLIEHHQLVCEDTANYLVIWCLDLEMEEKSALVEQVAHQVIVMQYILELAKQLDRDPRSTVPSFFSRMKSADKVYIEAFQDELKAFTQRIRDRAKVKLQEAIAEIEEEERQKRLGPGGLDPVEVMEKLPKEMQQCFETKDIAMLQNVITTFDPDDAKRYMEMCVDSGLWVPSVEDAAEQEADEDVEAETT